MNHEEELAKAKEKYDQEPNHANNLIWYGRRLAYLERYHEAIDVFARGIEVFPRDARMYRHRGHRYISTRHFVNAINDLSHATQLIEGMGDEIEPDGMPNEQDIPLSTLHFNIHYHLGLAYYLLGNVDSAAEAYDRCLKVSRNDDLLVATSNWYYMTLMRKGRSEEARSLLDPIHQEMEIIENFAYHRLLLFYKGEIQIHELTQVEGSPIMDPAIHYGLGMWCVRNDDITTARRYFTKAMNSGLEASFGAIAAEQELKKL